MNSHEKLAFVIRFEGLTAAEAGEQANLLQEVLLDAATDVKVDVQRDNNEAMDLGATLILLLGADAVVAIAKGIAAFIGRSRAVLIIEADGRIVFKGDSSDAARIVEALRARGSSGEVA